MEKHFGSVRFLYNKFLFNFPITLNFGAKKGNTKELNDKVKDLIKENYKDMHIIGIDRGERHLLYYSVINFKG